MDPNTLEVGKLIQMLTLASEDANVSQLLTPYVRLSEGTIITAAQALEQCEGQEPQNILSGYSSETGLTFSGSFHRKLIGVIVMHSQEQAEIGELLTELLGEPSRLFPASGESLDATNRKGVYIIYSPQGEVLHVGGTPRAKGGLAQRLRNHLHGKSSFTRSYFTGDGSRLGDGYTIPRAGPMTEDGEGYYGFDSGADLYIGKIEE